MRTRADVVVGVTVSAAVAAVALFLTSPKKVTACAMRPARVPARLCLKVLPDGGVVDFGEENVMQPGEWTGEGCYVVPCVELAK